MSADAEQLASMMAEIAVLRNQVAVLAERCVELSSRPPELIPAPPVHAMHELIDGLSRKNLPLPVCSLSGSVLHYNDISLPLAPILGPAAAAASTLAITPAPGAAALSVPGMRVCAVVREAADGVAASTVYLPAPPLATAPAPAGVFAASTDQIMLVLGEDVVCSRRVHMTAQRLFSGLNAVAGVAGERVVILAVNSKAQVREELLVLLDDWTLPAPITNIDFSVKPIVAFCGSEKHQLLPGGETKNLIE